MGYDVITETTALQGLFLIAIYAGEHENKRKVWKKLRDEFMFIFIQTMYQLIRQLVCYSEDS